MNIFLSVVVIGGAYFLGFLTAAILSAGSSADEWDEGYRQGRDEGK